MTQDRAINDCFGDDISLQNLRHITLAQMQQEHQRQRAALEPRLDDGHRIRAVRPALQWSRSHGED